MCSTFKYWVIAPKLISEPVAKTLATLIQNHNKSLTNMNRDQFIFEQTKRQNGSYRGFVIGFDKATTPIAKNLIRQARERHKVLKMNKKVEQPTNSVL